MKLKRSRRQCRAFLTGRQILRMCVCVCVSLCVFCVPSLTRSNTTCVSVCVCLCACGVKTFSKRFTDQLFGRILETFMFLKVCAYFSDSLSFAQNAQIHYFLIHHLFLKAFRYTIFFWMDICRYDGKKNFGNSNMDQQFREAKYIKTYRSHGRSHARYVVGQKKFFWEIF